MGRLSKEDLFSGKDLQEREVELPNLGGSVKVRALGAAYSLDAQTAATELRQNGNDQFVNVNRAKLSILQALHGLVDPKLDSYEEAERFAQKCGPSFERVIEVIDEISGTDKEALDETVQRFPAGGEGEERGDLAGSNGSGDRGPDVPVRAGGDAREERPEGALHG